MTSQSLQLVHELARCGLRVVFAESCTGGLVSSELARIPGVSQWLCGSAVTYRGDSKVQWLGVSAETLASHTAVSAEVTSEMARGVLERTPEASIAAAVTGHLGPDAPGELDGVVFTAIAVRRQSRVDVLLPVRHQLTSQDRVDRQHEAASLVFHGLLKFLASCK